MTTVFVYEYCCAAGLGRDPADMAAEVFDQERLRRRLRADLKATKGCRLEIILKDLLTVRQQPERLVWWVRMAREEIDRAWW